MLTAQRVSRTFNDGAAGFKNISFQIKEGEIVGILGTSGCGKSTLLRVLSGLDQGYEGSVSVQSEHETTQPIGMIFQEPRLMPWLNVQDNVVFGFPNGRSQRKEASRYLSLVGLAGAEKQLPRDLSGGMAQRTAIARALITKPGVLLLDEPFSALDAFTKMQLQDLLLDIWQKEKTTMAIVTHDIDEALYLCDRILVLSGQPGTVLAELTIDQPKPRNRGDKALAEWKAKILELLQE